MSLMLSVPYFPPAITGLSLNAPEPASVAGCTTMQWLPPCRYGAGTPYESCSWLDGRQNHDLSKWQMVNVRTLTAGPLQSVKRAKPS
jgi:hypothetical protein